jgi:8-oxo-dGTP diphosphatase
VRKLVRKVRWVAYRVALHVYRRLPVHGRRAAVRILAPTFTAGSIAVIEREDGAVLLIRQVYRRAWGLPGGLLNKLETPADAVVREVREELGVELEVQGRASLVMDLRPRRFDFVFRGRLANGRDEDPRPASAEIEEARWFRRDELPELQFETRCALQAIAAMDTLPLVIGPAGSVIDPGA